MKALMIIAPENFRDEEYQVPKAAFEASGIEVTVASTRMGTAKGMFGATANPSTTVDKVKAADYDALVVVGGSGTPAHLYNNRHIHTLAKDAYMQGKVVSAICLSGAVLANAGVLEGKKATVYPTPDSLALLKKGGAVYVKEGVVTDGRVITAEGPDYARPFAQAILKVLGSGLTN